MVAGGCISSPKAPGTVIRVVAAAFHYERLKVRRCGTGKSRCKAKPCAPASQNNQVKSIRHDVRLADPRTQRSQKMRGAVGHHVALMETRRKV